MLFEWDLKKARHNLTKHGISFDGRWSRDFTLPKEQIQLDQARKFHRIGAENQKKLGKLTPGPCRPGET